MGNNTLMTDFYELTMAQTYFLSGKQNEIAYFYIFLPIIDIGDNKWV